MSSLVYSTDFMEKKSIIQLTVGAVVGILLLIMSYTGYPSAWFVIYKGYDLGLSVIPEIVNSLIIIAIVLGLNFLFGFYKMLNCKAFFKYLVIAAGLFVLTLAALVFSNFKQLAFTPSFLLLSVQGILMPFLKNAALFMALIALLGNCLSLIPIKHYKNTILALSISIIYFACVIIFNFKESGLHLFYELSIAFGAIFLSYFIFMNDKDSLTPALYFGIYAIAEIPMLYSSNADIPNTAIFIIGIAYLVVGSIYFGMIILEDRKPKEDNKTESA